MDISVHSREIQPPRLSRPARTAAEHPECVTQHQRLLTFIGFQPVTAVLIWERRARQDQGDNHLRPHKFEKWHPLFPPVHLKCDCASTSDGGVLVGGGARDVTGTGFLWSTDTLLVGKSRQPSEHDTAFVTNRLGSTPERLDRT